MSTGRAPCIRDKHGILFFRFIFTLISIWVSKGENRQREKNEGEKEIDKSGRFYLIETRFRLRNLLFNLTTGDTHLIPERGEFDNTFFIQRLVNSEGGDCRFYTLFNSSHRLTLVMD